MKHLKPVVLLALAVVLAPAISCAAKSTYIATNHRFNYVKLKEVKASVAEERGMTHPATVDEQGLKIALEAIRLSRSFVIKKKVDSL